MALGKGHESGWFNPLLAHSSIHGFLTLIICLIYAPHLWWLALVDLATHFIIDRIKASPSLGGRFKLPSIAFWHALGVDQFFHHITHLFLIYVIIFY
jgi:hypothetical protein